MGKLILYYLRFDAGLETKLSILTENKVFYVSEEEGITIFNPRPSPSYFDDITGDVVFGISEKLLHNYPLPRDCPRVTYYAGAGTTTADRKKFLQTSVHFIIAIEAAWLSAIRQTPLYCYEFDRNSFGILDECAGYYVSYKAAKPIACRCIENPFEELLQRKNLELRIEAELWDLANEVEKSTLNYSFIRMRNAARSVETI